MGIRKILSRDFFLTFSAQLTFSSSLFILIPTLPIYLARLGSAEAEIGILIGTSSVSSLILRPFIGRALLRIPEKNFMLWGALLFILCSIAYIFLPPFWPFLMIRVFHGFGFALFYTASTTFIANISPEEHRGQSISYFFLAFNFAFALAPSFGMFLINRFNFTVLFLVCTALSLCSLFLSTRLNRREEHLPEDLSTTNLPILSRKALPPAVMAFFTHIIWGALTAFFPLYALEHGMSNPGLFFAAFAVMLILGRTFGGRILDLYSREKVIFPCLLTYIIATVILAFSETTPMFILVAIIWGAGNAFAFPAFVAYAIDLAGPSRGPALGTFTALSDLGVGLGAVIMGIVLRLTNFQTMFLCLAFTGVINLIYFYLFVMKKAKLNRAIYMMEQVEK
ncbi:MAG: MFS transporter [Deltaproteobacteria bacterium]|nr:MFS transporter [Deltaproteobacteria bacterium]